MRVFILLCVFMGLALAAFAASEGAAVAARCKACHSIAAGAPDKVGPNLWAVVGRGVAEREGYAYSPAMKALKGKKIWDEGMLDVYLTEPRETVAGTKMAFGGIKDAAERKALILWLKAQK